MRSKRERPLQMTNSTKSSNVLDTSGEIVIIDDEEDISPFSKHTISRQNIHASDNSSSTSRGKTGPLRSKDSSAVSKPKRRKMSPFRTDFANLFPKDRVNI